MLVSSRCVSWYAQVWFSIGLSLVWMLDSYYSHNAVACAQIVNGFVYRLEFVLKDVVVMILV